MTKDNRELDLDIVSTSWRSLSDAEAFRDLIEAWERKLAAASKQPRIPLVDAVLRTQLMSIDKLLDDRRNLVVEDPLEVAVSETPAPAMVLSPDGLVTALNDGASEYFGVKQGLQAGTKWLRDDCYADFASVRGSGPGGGNMDYAIVRLATGSNEGALAEVERLEVERTEGSYTVVRSLELEWYESVSTALRKAFGMTAAEADVCRLVFTFRDLDKVALERGASLETVRTQVKRILGKVEVHSKTELVRLLALLCARAAAHHDAKDLTWSDPLGREQVFIRSDGRKLGYTWRGAEDGRPILYVHSKIPFFLMSEEVQTELARRQLKLICPSNPGNGNSDAANAENQLEHGSHALVELCEHLGIENVPAFASYGGLYYLLRAAIQKPELFSSLLVLGIPWTIGEQSKSLPFFQQTFSHLAAHAPEIFALVAKIGLRKVVREGPDWYLRNAYGQNEYDRATIADPEFQGHLRAGCRHHLHQGVSAFVNEELMLQRLPLADWLKRLAVPTHWVAPISISGIDREALHAFRHLNAGFSVEIAERSGQLLPFQNPMLFIERLDQLASEGAVSIFRDLDFSERTSSRSLELAHTHI